MCPRCRRVHFVPASVIKYINTSTGTATRWRSTFQESRARGRELSACPRVCTTCVCPPSSCLVRPRLRVKASNCWVLLKHKCDGWWGSVIIFASNVGGGRPMTSQRRRGGGAVRVSGAHENDRKEVGRRQVTGFPVCLSQWGRGGGSCS